MQFSTVMRQTLHYRAYHSIIIYMSAYDDTSTERDTEAERKPQFKGCIFCYSAEWAYYGAKKGIQAIRR
jgi:hypothetical protein